MYLERVERFQNAIDGLKAEGVVDDVHYKLASNLFADLCDITQDLYWAYTDSFDLDKKTILIENVNVINDCLKDFHLPLFCGEGEDPICVVKAYCEETDRMYGDTASA